MFGFNASIQLYSICGVLKSGIGPSKHCPCWTRNKLKSLWCLTLLSEHWKAFLRDHITKDNLLTGLLANLPSKWTSRLLETNGQTPLLRAFRVVFHKLITADIDLDLTSLLNSIAKIKRQKKIQRRLISPCAPFLSPCGKFWWQFKKALEINTKVRMRSARELNECHARKWFLVQENIKVYVNGFFFTKFKAKKWFVRF